MPDHEDEKERLNRNLAELLNELLFIAATAYHRHRFARLEGETVRDKEEMVAAQDHLAVGGPFFLSVAMGGSVFVVFDLLFGVATATGLAMALIAVFAWFWNVLPLSRRARRT